MDNNNNEKLKNILQQSVDDEFKDVSDEPPFETSDKFEKNMKALHTPLSASTLFHLKIALKKSWMM